MRENPWVWMLRVAMTAAVAEASAVSAALASMEAQFPGARTASMVAMSFAMAGYVFAMLMLARSKAPAAEPELVVYDDIHPAMLRGRALKGHARLDGEPPWSTA